MKTDRHRHCRHKRNSGAQRQANAQAGTEMLLLSRIPLLQRGTVCRFAFAGDAIAFKSSGVK